MSEPTKGEQLRREDKRLQAHQLKFMKQFLRNKEIPVLVGQPEALNENEGMYHSKYLRFMNFSIHKNRYGMFTCSFPKGWKKVAMLGKNDWCYLVDDKGRRRAAICYKVLGIIRDSAGKKGKSFSAFINYMERFRAMADHVVPYDVVGRNTEEHYNSPIVGHILDGKDFIYTTKPIEMINKYGSKDYEIEEREIRSKLQANCQEILDEYMPGADNIFAYWNETEEIKNTINTFKNKLEELRNGEKNGA